MTTNTSAKPTLHQRALHEFQGTRDHQRLPLAGYLIMLLVLIPFFAFRVLSEALGEGRLERMFFIERRPGRIDPRRV